MKNFAGLEKHRTDELVYWNDRKPVEKMLPLREAYDLLSQIDKEKLELLISAAFVAGQHDVWDSNNADL